VPGRGRDILREISKRRGPAVARTYGNKSVAKRKKGPQGRRQQYVRRRRNAALALLAGILVIMGAAWYLDGTDEIRRGVSIGEVDVGGMTRQEAREAVEQRAARTFDEIRLGDEFSLSGEKLGVKADAAAAVDEAYSIGRQGWVGKRALEVARAFLGGVRVDTGVEYRQEAARAALEDVAPEFYEKPQNASFRVTDDGKIEVSKASDGRVLDREGTLANLESALSDMSNEVPIAADHKKPAVSTQEIEKLRPTQRIGKYRTDFLWDSNPNRQANMKLAAGAIDNTVLAPGEVFSFNKLAAPLDYGAAKTFSNGGIGYADGGGLCQVSSTLYMAAQYAGLQILERHPHYAVLPYIKPGFDATVWFGDEGGWGALDMKFKNTTDGYIVVREWVDQKGFLNAAIYGRPTGKKVELRTRKIFESTARGIKWATYKKVTDKNGKVLFNGLIHTYIYSYNPPVPEGIPHYDTSAPRVAGWSDPTNTTGWASPH
jgi:vancomycin resistance protein YoaR